MPGEKKRLFFALWPDHDTRQAILRHTRDLVAGSEGRPVLPQNLHITLAFLHSVDAESIPCICEAASRAAGESFDMALSRIGYWYRSRILWLAPEGDEVAGPAGLADALWRELGVCGFTPERRRYRPHVTLARKARSPGYPLEVKAVNWCAESFCLVQSITGQSQSEYRVLHTFPLPIRQAKSQ